MFRHPILIVINPIDSALIVADSVLTEGEFELLDEMALKISRLVDEPVLLKRMSAEEAEAFLRNFREDD